MGDVTETFPRARRSSPGYDMAQVDAFLSEARRAYESPSPETDLSSAEIRHTAFRLKKGGYSTSHVDAAMERLEDVFATRERERAVAAVGREAWQERARETAQVLLNRFSRPARQRFTRVGPLTVGYHMGDVDRLVSRLALFFQDGPEVTADQVRTAVFRRQRGGYREAQVDLALDAAIDAILAVR